MEDQKDQITTEMMEHICDHLCRFPESAASQEQLEDICAECKMGQFVCDLLNSVNGDLGGKESGMS